MIINNDHTIEFVFNSSYSNLICKIVAIIIKRAYRISNKL